MSIGETGSLTRGGFGATEDVRVDFTNTITDAVVMLTSTNAGGNEFSIVVTSVDDTGFTFRIDEWEDEDGPHPATETVNWIAVTPGVHTLPDGRIIEAGTTTATTTASAVTLNGNFDTAPVVLTNRMSRNDDDVSDSDPFNITSSGFDVALQEGSLSDGINTGETVGYIAIAPGGDTESGTAVSYDTLSTANQNFALDDTFTNGITLAETQSMNETDAGNVHFTNNGSRSIENVRFDEESGGSGTAHVAETVGLITFEQGIIPCYTAGTLIKTRRGSVDVTALVAGDEIFTRDNGYQRLRWLSKTRVGAARLRADPDLAPILIRKDAIAPDIPAADMWVSPQHRMLISGWKAELLSGTCEVLVPARALVNDLTVVQPAQPQVTYYHLLLDRHEVIYANNAPSESLYPGHMDLNQLDAEARRELLALVPDIEMGFGQAARQCLTVSQGRAYAA